jgi:hypothetical protein
VAIVVITVVLAIFASSGTAAAFLGYIGSIIGKISGALAFTNTAIEASVSIGRHILAGLYSVGAIANQFADTKRKGKAGPKTKAFCASLEGIINKIRPIVDQVWNASDYGKPIAREQGGLIAYSENRGYFGIAYPRSPTESNIGLRKGVWTNRQVNTPRGKYTRPGDEVYRIFDIHTHPFDTGQKILVTGDHRLAGTVQKAGNVEQPSIGFGQDTGSLDPSLIGIVVTKGAINIYTSVGRRCTFQR